MFKDKAGMEMTTHTIALGDSRQMREVPDESVHLAITSPPYWQLKDYGVENQIGFHDTYEQYINNLNLVWDECHRVLHKGSRLCVVVGDQFARSVFYGRYKVIPIRTEIIKFCESIGFDYMGAIIWQKLTTCNTSGGAVIMGSYPYPRNGIVKLDYEMILLFKKQGQAPPIDPEIKEKSRLSRDEWNQYFTGHWTIPGGKQHKHLAAYPEEIPFRLIRMFSFVGETVLDPFLGSGTTSLAAKKAGRNSIGFEINRKTLSIIEQRLGVNELLPDATFRIKELGVPSEEILAEKRALLPYTFKDFLPVEKKIDPRHKTFGSKIAVSQPPGEQFSMVKEIISPERLLLSDGTLLQLLGIRANIVNDWEAIDFLAQITKGQKVFFRQDKKVERREGTILCYLYLKNRTFINARLIKTGLVEVDLSFEYAKRKTFLSCSPHHQ
jgi:modification methylase